MAADDSPPSRVLYPEWQNEYRTALLELEPSKACRTGLQLQRPEIQRYTDNWKKEARVPKIPRIALWRYRRYDRGGNQYLFVECRRNRDPGRSIHAKKLSVPSRNSRSSTCCQLNFCPRTFPFQEKERPTSGSCAGQRLTN